MTSYGRWLTLIICIVVSVSSIACDLKQTLYAGEKSQASICGKRMLLIQDGKARAYEFPQAIDQAFLPPDRGALGVRSGESLGMLQQGHITYISKMEGLRQVLPLADGGVVLLLRTGHGSTISYMKERGEAAVLWESRRRLIDMARLQDTQLALLSDDGLLEILDLGPRKILKTLPVALGSDRVFYDQPSNIIWVFQRRDGTAQRCLMSGGSCGKKSGFPQGLELLTDINGASWIKNPG